MLETNPFLILSDSVPVAIMQGFIIAMVVLIALGTIIQMIHHKNIIKKDISINKLKEYDEIILIGSGKGIASVKTIDQIKWKRKSLKFYKILLNHYQTAIKKCRRY